MTKFKTKAAAVEEYEKEHRLHWLHRIVLIDFLEGKKYETTSTFRYVANDSAKTKGAFYATVHGVDRADGGYVVVMLNGKLHDVDHLESWEESWGAYLRASGLGDPETDAMARLFHAVRGLKREWLDKLKGGAA
jgi:hypothetical protein